jgi:phosphinothricin acetyltransferase
MIAAGSGHRPTILAPFRLAGADTLPQVSTITLRLAVLDDAEAIRQIYNYEVENTTATFDLVPRTLQDQRDWLAARSGAFSAIVAVDDDVVMGFSALSAYKERAAYRTTVEDSVYVHRDAHGRGIGRLLLDHVLDVAEDSGFHAVMARIEASGTASRALHARCGFELVGVEREIGRKFGRWLDVALMQCLLHERRARLDGIA